MTVSTDDLRLAATWLDLNEGPNGEAEACARVAQWLEKEIERRNSAVLARAVSAKVGRKVTPAEARAALERSKRK